MQYWTEQDLTTISFHLIILTNLHPVVYTDILNIAYILHYFIIDLITKTVCVSQKNQSSHEMFK